MLKKNRVNFIVMENVFNVEVSRIISTFDRKFPFLLSCIKVLITFFPVRH
jgi:hypothetical protein